MAMAALNNKNDNQDRAKVNPHFVILGIILFVFLAAVVRLLIWNRGIDSEYDPTENTSQFDVETEDFIMQLDPRFLEGRKDDGVTTILCLGNEAFASERGETGVTAKLADKLNATVYNGAFNHTTMSAKNTAFDKSYPNDAFSLYWLTRTLTLQDFTLLDNTLEAFEAEDADAADTLTTLKNIDMDKVDVLFIMYDGHDYLDDRIITSPYDLSDIGTCTGSLNQSLAMLQESYPHIRLVVMSPAFACMVDDDGGYLSGGTTRTSQNNYALPDYMIAYKNIAVENSASFIDHYNGTITEGNYKEYLEDHILLNEKGRELIASRMAGLIQPQTSDSQDSEN